MDPPHGRSLASCGYFPAAFRSASLIRSCQPGPPSLKWSSPSAQLLSAYATFAVAFLNAASASLRASFSVRGRLGGLAIF